MIVGKLIPAATGLGLADGESRTALGGAIEPDLLDLEDTGGNGGSALGFTEELADLDLPDHDGDGSGE